MTVTRRGAAGDTVALSVVDETRRRVVTPTGTGMLPPRVQARGGGQSPEPMTDGTRAAAYRAQTGSRRLTPRQQRQHRRMRMAAMRRAR